jgi:hypothetical protein
MLDISEDLLKAASMRSEWTRDQGRLLALTLSDSIPDAGLDWDEDAGEEWARILVEEDVAALVRIRIPLVIVVRQEARRIGGEIGDAAILIVVDDMDALNLSAQEDSLLMAFPERELSANLDPEEFSSSDLWFATS